MSNNKSRRVKKILKWAAANEVIILFVANILNMFAAGYLCQPDEPNCDTKDTMDFWLPILLAVAIALDAFPLGIYAIARAIEALGYIEEARAEQIKGKIESTIYLQQRYFKPMANGWLFTLLAEVMGAGVISIKRGNQGNISDELFYAGVIPSSIALAIICNKNFRIDLRKFLTKKGALIDHNNASGSLCINGDEEQSCSSLKKLFDIIYNISDAILARVPELGQLRFRILQLQFGLSQLLNTNLVNGYSAFWVRVTPMIILEVIGAITQTIENFGYLSEGKRHKLGTVKKLWLASMLLPLSYAFIRVWAIFPVEILLALVAAAADNGIQIFKFPEEEYGRERVIEIAADDDNEEGVNAAQLSESSALLSRDGNEVAVEINDIRSDDDNDRKESQNCLAQFLSMLELMAGVCPQPDDVLTEERDLSFTP